MIEADTLFFNNSKTPCEVSDIEMQDIITTIRCCERINNQSFLLIDFDKHTPIYTSNHLLYINEATKQDFKRISLNPYWSLVDDNTLEILFKMKNSYASLRKMMTKDEYDTHVCMFDYPISINRKEFYIKSRYSPLTMTPEGESKLGLFTITPSCKQSLACLITNSSSSRRWTYDFNTDEFRLYEPNIKLTSAEKAIMERAWKGMSNDSIATDLCLSVNTIKSHRQRIFKKLGVDTITEALLVASDYNLL